MNSPRAAILAAFGLACAAALSPAASATSAIASVTIGERAGPSTYYPVVDTVPSGAPITLFGCLGGGSWCDVSYAGVRGWVPGSYIEAYYQSQPVFVPDYVAVIGIPIISFDIDAYWNDYYRDRPFFADRVRFERYAHGPGARIALAQVPGPRGPHGRPIAAEALRGPSANLVAAQKGPHGVDRRFVAGPAHPQTLAAAGPRNRHLIGTNAPRPMIVTGGRNLRFAAGPKFAAGPHHPQFAMGPRGGGKFCRGKGACG